MKNESKVEATDRLRREGRWPEASKFREDTRQKLRAEGMPKAEVNEAAWLAMIQAFPPLDSSVDEVETSISWPDDVDIEIFASRQEGTPDLSRDVLWVYENIHNRRASVTDAPSLGAWSMLQWARGSRQRFFEQLLPKILSSQQKQPVEDDWRAQDEQSIKEIEQMLLELTSGEETTKETIASTSRQIEGEHRPSE